MPPLIRTEGLAKRFGATTALDSVSFEVDEGEVYALLGPNGAGKTTIIRLLLDLIRPTSGSASVAGLDCRSDAMEVRRMTSYLPGELRLPPRWTGREAVGFFAELRGVHDKEQVTTLADALDVDLGRRVGELSKGNRQKVGLVGAMLGRPRLMVFDEPTSGLDPVVQQTFHQLVDAAVAEGATVLISSHVLGEVQRVAHRAGVMRAGRMVSVLTIGELVGHATQVIEIRFADPPDPTEFAGIDGVLDTTLEGATLRCRVTGGVDAVIKAAARHTVLGITSHEPSLEDLFLELVE